MLYYLIINTALQSLFLVFWRGVRNWPILQSQQKMLPTGIENLHDRKDIFAA